MKARRYWSFGVLAACVTAAVVLRQFAFVAWYPVGMSAFLAAAFGFSLLAKPLCLELAEAIPPHILPDGALPYCRKLTAVWCAVLAFNGLVAAATVFAPRWIWFAWNCALSYGLMGTVILVERAVRRRVFSVTFHTSGSTAAPKEIVKPFESLAAEVAYHRDVTVAVALKGKPVFISTVEPEHMYGILWRVLLPRAAGCTACPEVILTPETLLDRMRAAERVFLVTTPSFLERFCAYADQYEVPRNCVEMTTSGALLSAKVSAAAKRVFGIAPLEIFGSTETGGVAWRRQGEEGDSSVWTVMDQVKAEVSDDGRLVVDSPYSCEKGFVMGDRVEMAPDRRHFKLLGRGDRMAKIAERRVSLPEMEDKMRTVPGIREAALAVLDGPHGQFLGAAVVPDLKGIPPRKLRKRTLALELRKKLLPVFPPGTVPRKYRFVHELPRNAQGKVQADELHRLFEASFAEPFVLDEKRGEGSWEGRLVFDPEAAYAQGHFPGFPILAGVVQLGTAHHFAECLLRRKIALKAVKKMKFSGVVRPGETVELSLTVRSHGQISYTYRKGERACASGIMEF